MYHVELDEYEVANLRALLQCVGYPAGAGAQPSNPFHAANTGDWVGQVYNKLPDTGYLPNVTPEEMVRAAKEWERT